MVEVDGLTVSVWLHTNVDPPMPEWDEAIATIQSYMAEHATPLERLRGLVVSDGGAPNARQRKALQSDVHKDRRSKAVVLTPVLSNPLKRGIATAIQWVNPDFHFHQPHEVAAAMTWIDLPGRFDALYAALLVLQQRLPTVNALAMAAATAGLPPPPAR